VSSQPLQVADTLQWATRLLTAAGVDSPRLDAELLLGQVLGCDRARLRAFWADDLSAPTARRYAALVQRRAQREPVAYLLGQRPFYDIALEVTPAVLVPRPETEHLVEAALAWARRQPRPGLRIVDVGTGSGAIAIVLARHLPAAQVLAVDLSGAALQVARRNVARLGLAHRVALLQADLLTPLAGSFDLIAANLPYVDCDELPTLMPEVSRFEPSVALDGGPGGLVIVQRLMGALTERLAPGGLAMFELDPRQMAAARTLALGAVPAAAVDVIYDYAGHERVLTVERRAG